MFSISKYAGLGVLLAIVFASGSAAADSESDCQLDTYELAPTLKLRDENPACYEQINTQIAYRDDYDKYHLKKNRATHWFFGELQAKTYGTFTNNFESFQSGLSVIIDDTGFQWGIEGGWVDKKWFRDFWAAIHPASYLKRDARWAIDAWKFTGKIGYTAVAEDVISSPEFENKFTWTVTTSYTLPFDKLTGDID